MAAKSAKDSEVINITHEHSLHVPSRTIWLESSKDDEGEEHGVNYSMFSKFHKNIKILEHISNDPIQIYMNTGGGSMDNGMAIYDTIKQSPCHITINVIGLGMSMGCVILQSADRRLLYPFARIMFHLGSGHSNGNHLYEAYNAVHDDIKMAKRIDKIIFEAIQTKHPKFTMKKYNELNNSGKFMSAEEAIAMGLADDIISDR